MKNTAKLVIAGLLLLQFLPYFLLGEGSYVRIHDNLEAEWLWYHLLVDTGTALDFSDGTVVAPVMNGLLRSAFHTGLHFNVIWITVFGTFWGYVFNYCLVHLVAFIGMYYLLRKHFLVEVQQQYIAVGVALCFAWIPVFTAMGMTVAGQPLLFLAFLNLLGEKGRWWDWLTIILFPFYASIVWAAPAVLGLLFLIGVSDSFSFIKWEKISSTARSRKQFWGAFALLTCLLLLANFQLIGLMANADFVPHRAEYDYFHDKELGFINSFLDSLMLFFISHYHVGIFVGLPILAMAAMSFYYKGNTFFIKAILGLILAICLFYGFYSWFVYLFGDLPLISTLKFDRVSILLPLLWCLLMALSLKKINQKRLYSVRVGSLITIQFLIIFISNDEFLQNTRLLIGQEKKPAYNAYLAKDLFNEIKQHIDQPTADYRVMSLGMNPGIALFNGFYTLDGLQAIYDLKYKKQFRKIISQELDKDQQLQKYFDGWGNRCYLFSAELGKDDKAFLTSKSQGKSVKNLDINTTAFKALGGEYILSALPINNAAKLGFNLEKTFENDLAYWKIYLYKLKNETQPNLSKG